MQVLLLKHLVHLWLNSGRGLILGTQGDPLSCEHLNSVILREWEVTPSTLGLAITVK